MRKLLVGLFLLETASLAVAQTTAIVQPPTASEVFQLRSECAALSDKLLGSLVGSSGPLVSQTGLSHYEPATNRCYAIITSTVRDNAGKLKEEGQYLYDGQTQEQLAATRTYADGKTGGWVFDETYNGSHFSFDDASKYITARIADDRKQ